jgi:transcription elongation factor GreA
VKIKNQSNGMEMNYKLVAESEADLKTGISYLAYREGLLGRR